MLLLVVGALPPRYPRSKDNRRWQLRPVLKELELDDVTSNLNVVDALEIMRTCENTYAVIHILVMMLMLAALGLGTQPADDEIFEKRKSGKSAR